MKTITTPAFVDIHAHASNLARYSDDMLPSPTDDIRQRVVEAYSACPQLIMYGVFPSANNPNRWAYTVFDTEQARHRRFVTDSLGNVMAKLCLTAPDDDTDE